ncbi:hypothetical protein TNCV_3020631 [Trichonephila clavipes]|nr:hypothetical protein TNCV_3020631 [Trichonephila clavipes]
MKVRLLRNRYMPYTGFELEPTRLLAEDHIHLTGWVAWFVVIMSSRGCCPRHLTEFCPPYHKRSFKM